MESRINSVQFQIKQAKSLLNDFKKTKAKCLELSDHLGCEIKNLQQYQIQSINCTHKLQSPNHEEVIKLKKQLIKSLSQLYEVERDLTYQMQKNSFKKSIKTPIVIRNQTFGPSSNIQERQFDIPNYQSHVEPNNSKIQRIASFVLSLSKSMVTLRKSMAGKWEQKQIYRYQPEYIEMIRQLEQFQMRDEELGYIIERRFQEQLHQIMNNSQKIQEHKDYYILKVKKTAIQNPGSFQQKNNFPIKQAQPQSHNNIKRSAKTITKSSKGTNLFKKMSLQNIPQQKLIEIQKREQSQLISHRLYSNLPLTLSTQNNQTDGQTSVLQKNQFEGKNVQINELSIIDQANEQNKISSSIMQSISSLRQIRKKVFDDDIWNEFQKI